MNSPQSPYSGLSQAELLALAMTAAKADDDGRAMAYLKEATARPDASAEAHFLLGSQYAQVGLAAQGLDHIAKALELAPNNELVRFQLGLLFLSSAMPEQARQTWEPLLSQGESNPLAVYARGLCHLMVDEFSQARQWLERGLQMNAQAPTPTDSDMRKVLASLDQIDASAAAPAEAKGSGAEEPVADHLFINAYKDGKVH